MTEAQRVDKERQGHLVSQGRTVNEEDPELTEHKDHRELMALKGQRDLRVPWVYPDSRVSLVH